MIAPPPPRGAAAPCLSPAARLLDSGPRSQRHAPRGNVLQTVIVGAGLTGLTVAHEMAARGHPVTVLERGDAVGGLARSFRYAEGAFDVGPHRFHTDDAAVLAFVRGVLGEELREIPRRSAVRVFGRVHDWPLRPGVLAALPPGLMLRAVRDLLLRERLPGDSFEAEIVRRWGRTLFEGFFRPYTERFLDLPASRIHRDWARAGVDRAVIDRRVPSDGLAGLARMALLPRPVDTRFLYPAAGIGRLAERLAERIAAGGGRVLLGRPATALEVEGGAATAVVAGGERLAARAVVWTGPIGEACRLAGLPRPELRFRAMVLYNVALRAPPRLGRQWVYFGEDAPFLRVSDPAAFSPEAVPPGRGALCAERTCAEGDALWRDPERHRAEVVEGLVRFGAIASAGDVAAVRVERVADAYPVYELGYPAERDRAVESLRRVRNLLVAGRCGRFWYNNMDHSIAQGLRIAAQLAAGAEAAEVDVGDLRFWER